MDELSNHFLFMTNAFKKRFNAQFAAEDPVRFGYESWDELDMTIRVKVINLDTVVTMKSILESAPKEVYLKMMAFLLSIKELPGGEAIFKANNGQRSNKAIVMAAFGACKSSYQFAEYVSKTHVIKIKKGKLDPPVPMKTIFKEGTTKAVEDLTRLLLYVKQALSDKAGENVYNANKFEKGRLGNAREI